MFGAPRRKAIRSARCGERSSRRAALLLQSGRRRSVHGEVVQREARVLQVYAERDSAHKAISYKRFNRTRVGIERDACSPGRSPNGE